MTSQGAGEPLHPGEYIPASLACAFTGWAYLDTSAADGSIRFKPDSSATFRYVENEHPLTRFAVSGAGSTELTVLADEKPVGRGQSGQPIPVMIEPGMHEITIVFETDSYTLFGFQLTS